MVSLRDKVKISIPRDDELYYLDGQTGEVIDINEDKVSYPIAVKLDKPKHIIPKLEEGMGSGRNAFQFAENELELVQSTNFAIGNKVVINDRFPGKEIVGKAGIVESTDPKGVWVKLEGERVPWLFYHEDLDYVT